MVLKTIWIYGTGGVGGFFGGKMAYALRQGHHSETRVYFIARGKHLEEIRAHGLTLNTPTEKGLICTPAGATDNPSDLPAPDLVLLCVKSYDLENALDVLAERVSDTTVILPLLNGVDIYDRVQAALPRSTVFPGCVYVGTHIEKPGTITQNGGEGAILFGPDPGHSRRSADEVIQLFELCGIKHRWNIDPFPAIWEKYMFIAPFGMVCAASGKTLDEVMAAPELKNVVTAIMREVEAIARARGVQLAPDIVERSLAKAASFPAGTKTSFQRDVERGGKNEGDLFGGTILRIAGLRDIPTPATFRVYQMLQKK